MHAPECRGERALWRAQNQSGKEEGCPVGPPTTNDRNLANLRELSKHPGPLQYSLSHTQSASAVSQMEKQRVKKITY